METESTQAAIEALLDEQRTFPPPEDFAAEAVVNDESVYRRAAEYVVEILKGAKPGDLPVKLPSKFEIFVNLKTAKQIGVVIPQHVLVQADKVIK